MSRFLLVALLFLGVATLSYADTCLQTRSLKPKEACAGVDLSCTFGYYCDRKGYCSPYKAAGEECVDTLECVSGTTCKGSGPMKCVTNANPGENCNSTTVSDVPSCGFVLSCSLNGTCTNGKIGDKCTQNSDCSIGLNCTAGFCKGLSVGETCFASYQCDTGLYCDNAFPTSTCKALLTSGKCDSVSQCAYGYSCIGASPSDATQCVKWGTKKVGEFCSFDSQLCEGDMRCLSRYCAAGTPKYCTSGSDGQCPYNKHCTCSSNKLRTGIGMCTPNPCYELDSAYSECLSTKCKGLENIDYANSCVNLNCKDQRAKQVQCNPAVRVAVSILVLVATLVTLFI